MRETFANLFVATVTVFMFAVPPLCISAPAALITATQRSPFVQPMCSHWPSMEVAQSRFPGCCGAGYFECRFRNGSHESCIPLHQFHDGYFHCEDGSDEACFPGQMRCGDFCADLIHSAECIRYPHCHHHNDGSSPNVFSAFTPIIPDPVIGVNFCKSLNRTLCGSLAAISCRGYGDCVYGASLMDGRRDCFDGSDEDPIYVALFKSIGTRPVFPVFNPLAPPTVPTIATAAVPTISVSSIPFNKPTTLSVILAIGRPNNEHPVRLINPDPTVKIDMSQKNEVSNLHTSIGMPNNPFVESAIPSQLYEPFNPPKEPFTSPKESAAELPVSVLADQTADAGIGIGLGIGVGQLSIPKQEVIRPANDHWNMKYIPLPSLQPNSSRLPIKATSIPFLVSATNAENEPAIESTTAAAVAAQTDVSPGSEVTPRRRLDFDRYYLWPNQDGWVIFPANENDSASHERLPAQPGGVFMVKPAKVAPIADRRATPIDDANQILWPTANTAEMAIPSSSESLVANDGKAGETRQLDSIYLLDSELILTTTTTTPATLLAPLVPIDKTTPISFTTSPTEIGLQTLNTPTISIEHKPEPIVPEKTDHFSPVLPVFVPSIRSGILTAERVVGGAVLPLPPTHYFSAESDKMEQPLLPLEPILPVNALLAKTRHQFLESATSTTITVVTTVIITEMETTTICATRSTVPEAEGLFETTNKVDNIVDLAAISSVVNSNNCTETNTSIEETTITPTEVTKWVNGPENLTVSEAECEEKKSTKILTPTQLPINELMEKSKPIDNGLTSSTEYKYHPTDQTAGVVWQTSTMSGIDLLNGFIAPVFPIIKSVAINKHMPNAGSTQAQATTHLSTNNTHKTFTTTELFNVTLAEAEVSTRQPNLATTEMSSNVSLSQLTIPAYTSGSVSSSAFPIFNNVKNDNLNASIASTVIVNDSTAQPLSEGDFTKIVSTVAWAQTGIEAAALSRAEKEMASLNCTQRVRELARRFALSPVCDCPPGQMRDARGICQRADVATFRARLTRFCGARTHLDSLTGDTQAAIVFTKLAAALPNVSICIRQSAGALVIVNAQCGASYTFDELQQEYYAAHQLMSEIDLKIAELEESACYQPTLNDCDGRLSECVPLGIHYICECLPGVIANATRDADGISRCRDDNGWRHGCTRILSICALYWLIGALLLCALIALLLYLWVNLCESGAAAWNDCCEKYFKKERPRRLPTGEYSAYAAIYRIMRLVSNLVDEEKLATLRTSPVTSRSVADQEITENTEKDEEGEDVGKWLERPSDERATPPPAENRTPIDTTQNAAELLKTDNKTPTVQNSQRPELRKGEFVAKHRKNSLASEGSTKETLWENYQHHPSMPPKMNGRQESEDSIDFLIRQREEQLQRAHQEERRALPADIIGTSTAVVLAEAARKVEAEIKREVEGGTVSRVTEKPAHFRQLPAAAPNAPPPSQAEIVAALMFRSKRRGSNESQRSTVSNVIRDSTVTAELRLNDDSRKSLAGLEWRRMSDESGTKPICKLSRQMSDGGPPRERGLSRATFELAEHRALRQQAMYGAYGCASLTASRASSTAQPTAPESPIGSIVSLPPVHPSRRPVAFERDASTASVVEKRQRDGVSIRQRSIDSTTRKPIKATHQSLGNRYDVSPSSLTSPKCVQPRSVPVTSKSPIKRRPVPRNPQSQNESASTDIAQLPISLSYPSIRERYATRQKTRSDDALLPVDMDLDLPGPYVRPAKTRNSDGARPTKTRDSGKSGGSRQSSSTIARKIASRRAAAPLESKSTHKSGHSITAPPPTSARSEELTTSARERLERLRKQFDEKVHSGCLKNRPPWDGSPAHSRDSPASSGGLSGAAARFGGSQLSLTGLQMRRARSSGDFSTRGGSSRRGTVRRSVAQRRFVTFNETSIELGERSRSMMDVPRTRQRGKQPSSTAAASAVPPRRLSRVERTEANARAEAIRRTNEFQVDNSQRDVWLERFKDTINSKSWLDYD